MHVVEVATEAPRKPGPSVDRAPPTAVMMRMATTTTMMMIGLNGG